MKHEIEKDRAKTLSFASPLLQQQRKIPRKVTTMNALLGYRILAEIYESPNSLVYRGIREKDNQAVILKFLREEYPTPEEIIRYKQEYKITHNLNLEGVVKAYSLEKYQNSLVIIFEDFG
ncbi:MAG TPA: hypothetical protein DCP31_35625, partial [Cyanobacteria bacterium UBA8543]|nr:hypothetical protein [Cyanobacteria bacterium UBA8543]